MVYLTRRERFNAAHRLYNKEWSNQKNFEVFGKCSNPNYHGHNFELFVTVKGNPNKESGLVINAKTLSNIVKENIINKLDHKNLNLEVEILEDTIPSIENVVIAIWNELATKLDGCQLHCIKLVETENIYVEYFGS